MAFDVTIKEYLKQINEASLLTADQERSLGTLILEENDPRARDQLVRSNLRLVVNIAKRYADRGMSLGDLIEEGNLGLIKAVDYYDPDRGTRFSTYAAWWIKQSIKRALLANTKPLHIPTYMVALINQWRHAQAEMENRLGRRPTSHEMAEIMQITPRKAKFIYHIVCILGSVQDTDDDCDENHSLAATLQDPNTGGPEDELVADEEKAKALRLLNQIDPRQADIIRMHYGLDGRKPLTLKEIAEKLNLTRERIRQLQRQALTTLYEFMNE
ncbi:MAG TPA: RNA polymerase sigma factor RpoD/SigA [Sedimentisphaerales bacterium]|nr:RNA polymerase sigma factor RpoD/SigA [Sedimentisphaerales bacterium]